MKILKTANYEKLANQLPGEDRTSYFVRQTQQNIDKGFEIDVAMELAQVPPDLRDVVQQQLQTVSKPFDSVDEGMAGLGTQAVPVNQQVY